MRSIHERFPLYNFEQHKGYGTAAHVAAIHKFGPCPYHRMTFAPLKTMKARASPKAASVLKASSTQLPKPAVLKRGRAAVSATVDTQAGAPASASCAGNSERDLRLRRRIENISRNFTYPLLCK
jgi:hypothetical protein